MEACSFESAEYDSDAQSSHASEEIESKPTVVNGVIVTQQTSEKETDALRELKKSRGRKRDWPEKWAVDLIDIILGDEKLKQKLLLAKVKTVKNGHYFAKVVEALRRINPGFRYNVNQTRGKFKRCVNICKNAKSRIKTRLGLQRYQEEKELGKWFERLLDFVPFVDADLLKQNADPSPYSSPEPDHAAESNAALSPQIVHVVIEQQSAESSEPLHQLTEPSCSVSYPQVHVIEPSPSESLPDLATEQRFARRGRVFSVDEVPCKKSKQATGFDAIANVLQDLRESLRNDPTRELIAIMREESVRQAERDNAFLNLMASMVDSETHRPFPIPSLQQSPIRKLKP